MTPHAPTKPLSYSQIGAALGISKQAVARQAAKGMPISSVDAARAWRDANLDPARAKDARLTMQSAPPRAPPPPPAGEDEPRPDDSLGYKLDRARRERTNADLAELELARLRGHLVDRDEVARLRYTEFRALRDALGNIPQRVKDQVAAELDPLRCEDLIALELEAVLDSFADNVLTRGITHDDADNDDAPD